MLDSHYFYLGFSLLFFWVTVGYIATRVWRKKKRTKPQAKLQSKDNRLTLEDLEKELEKARERRETQHSENTETDE